MSCHALHVASKLFSNSVFCLFVCFKVFGKVMSGLAVSSSTAGEYDGRRGVMHCNVFYHKKITYSFGLL